MVAVVNQWSWHFCTEHHELKVLWTIFRVAKLIGKYVQSKDQDSTAGYTLQERRLSKIAFQLILALEPELDTIFKMIGTLVQVKSHTFSFRKALIQPQKLANWGQKRSKLGFFKMAPQIQPKCFWHLQHMINNRQLEKGVISSLESRF